MRGEEAVIAVIDALDTSGVGYMLVGSLATNFYGVPRATEDADFVVELGEVPLAEVMDRLGPAFQLDRQGSFETITMTQRRLIHVASNSFTIEFFYLSDDDHDQQRFQRRRRVTLFGRQVSLPTAEDMIVTKLRWAIARGGIKDRDDARDVIAIQGEHLDWNYIDSWADRHGTRALLEKIRHELSPDVTSGEGMS